MPQPLLHLGNVRVVRQGIGRRGGAQRMPAKAMHVGTDTVAILPPGLDAPLSASFLFLGRHEYHQTGGRLADLLRGPAEHNIQQTSFTMTAQDQQIGLHVGRDLHNDVPGISRAQDGGDLQTPLDLVVKFQPIDIVGFIL
jgi:hypothetical protein